MSLVQLALVVDQSKPGQIFAPRHQDDVEYASENWIKGEEKDG